MTAIADVAAPADQQSGLGSDLSRFDTVVVSALRPTIGAIVMVRLAANGSIRVVYPFLPVIAIGSGLSFQTLVLLVTIRSLAGLAGPLVVRVASPSRWVGMIWAAQFMVICGCIAVIVAPAVPHSFRIVVLGSGLLASGLARPVLDLPTQAWLASRVMPSQRGRAFGVVELGWALSLLATVPLTGILIDIGGWRHVFTVVLVLTVIGLIVTRASIAPAVGTRRIPVATRSDEIGPTPSSDRVRVSGGDDRWRLVAIGGAVILIVAAGELLLVTYGVWLTSGFGLSTGGIGLSAVMIVAAELIGGGFVALMSDRLGLRVTLLGALLMSSWTAIALGQTATQLPLALCAIGVWFALFEVSIITLVALASSVTGRGRHGTSTLGWLMGAIACGNAVGAASAPALFSSGGLTITTSAAAASSLAAAAIIWRLTTSDGTLIDQGGNRRALEPRVAPG